MLPNLKRDLFKTYNVRNLTTVYFENYEISRISLFPIEKRKFFGNNIEGKFFEKLEGKIVVKTWYELQSIFPECKLGRHSLKEDAFSGILSIDNSLSLENSKKLIPIIVGRFKSRSTKLLNQFHGTYGRIFWENNYDELRIENLADLNNALIAFNKKS
jgi:hypothetical protein